VDRQQFQQLASAGYTRILLQRELLADLETPLSTWLKLARGRYSYLLESVQGGEKWGRYSIIGLPCRQVIKVYGHTLRLEEDDRLIEEVTIADPLVWIEAFHRRQRVAPIAAAHRFTGGLVGYFGYDTVRYIEPRLGPCRAADPLGVPDILLMVSDEVVVFDNLTGKLHLVVQQATDGADSWERGQARLQQLAEQLAAPLCHPPYVGGGSGINESDFVSGFTQAGFEAAVARSHDYIAAGDIMQVVLSQRLSIPFAAPPLDLYRALRSLNPSPYMFFLELGDHQVVGSSPEILVHSEEGTVTVRPIAGTRPRGRDPQHDKALEAELLADPKERAEHLMLIDLGRNDVGRIAATGTVAVTERMVIERYSHVMHIVSNVEGQLRPGMSAMDVLRATFPAGTVSGAPKIRAMEIIDELEPVKRGIYAGAVGYWAWNGNLDTAIAIRTSVIKDGQLHIQAGAGIVYDSIPRNEWEETMNKGRATFRAVAQAAAGL
jgi:anthranilate synthase component I